VVDHPYWEEDSHQLNERGNQHRNGSLGNLLRVRFFQEEELMNRTLFHTGPKPTLFPTRFYQDHCIPQFRAGIRAGHFHSIGQAPCRYGKTVVSAHIFASALKKGSRCLFGAPRRALIDQTVDSFLAQGLDDIGVMMGDDKRYDPNAMLQVGCWDTLYSRDPGEFDLVILDEIHMADARMWELKKRWKIVLGWTATPWAKGLGLHFTKLHIFATIPEMIGYNAVDRNLGLVPGRGIGPRPDLIAGLENIKTNDEGEFQEKPACAFMDRHEVIADEVDTWLRTRQEGKHPGDRTLHFIRRRASAKARLEAFAAQGVRFDYIDAFTDDRSPIFERFRRRESHGIMSVGCLTTGVDVDARCIIDAAPSNSEMTIVQKLMRGGTPAEGKEYYWLNDHAGNANRFGWYEDIYHDVLDTTPPQVKGCAYQQEDAPPQEKKKQKQCSVCRELLRHGALVCPNCGNQVVEDTTVVIKGELGELIPHESGKKEKKTRLGKSEEQAFYSGLIDFAQRRGFKEGWAANKFREKFGVWPNKLDKTPMTPRKAVKEFIAESGRKWREQKSKMEEPQPEYRGEF
jgi:superfamily II DNA or RNA helicase